MSSVIPYPTLSFFDKKEHIFHLMDLFPWNWAMIDTIYIYDNSSTYQPFYDSDSIFS